MNGGDVVSVDPIYSFTKDQIADRIASTYNNVIEQTRRNQDKFVWDEIKSVEELGNVRMNAMNTFLNTYENGRDNGSYISGSLPTLDFAGDSFDISLSSHFLFLYSANLDYDFHLKSVCEMLRVSSEARIFPLLDVNAERSLYIDRIITELSQFDYEIRRVKYEFQKGGNELLVITRKKQND
jgi:hypothetical protein